MMDPPESPYQHECPMCEEPALDAQETCGKTTCIEARERQRQHEEVVEKILMTTDIVEVIQQYVELQRNERGNYNGTCPFCGAPEEEKFVVSPSKQLFYCFGCHASGNVI